MSLSSGRGRERPTGPIVTPFGGSEHDWSAIELAAWLAAALGTTLRLVGTEADPALGRRDASRLLARASLLVQQMVGIVTEPRLSSRETRPWSRQRRTHGCSSSASPTAGRRRASAPSEPRSRALRQAPTLFVRAASAVRHRSCRATMTRFTWTHAASAAQ